MHNTKTEVILTPAELFKKCLHSIRNMNPLDKEMLNNIRDLSDENKMDIIIELNKVMNFLKVQVESCV